MRILIVLLHKFQQLLIFTIIYYKLIFIRLIHIHIDNIFSTYFNELKYLYK